MHITQLLRKGEIFSLAASWMDLEYSVWNKRSQRKTNSGWFHICVVCRETHTKMNEQNETIQPSKL